MKQHFDTVHVNTRGTWQGLYLFEQRDRAHARAITIYVIGE